MLYLISQKGLKTFKIGYTESINNRMKAYKTCMGSEPQWIEIIEGTKEDEKKWHQHLKDWNFEKVSKNGEWFYLPKWLKKETLLKNGFKALEIYQTWL